MMTAGQRIKFLESKIDQYAKTIQQNEKGQLCVLWISWLQAWNNEIIELKLKPHDEEI